MMLCVVEDAAAEMTVVKFSPVVAVSDSNTENIRSTNEERLQSD